MMTMRIGKQLMAVMSAGTLLFAAACGGSQGSRTSGLGAGTGAPKPPDVTAGGGTGNGGTPTEVKKVEFTKDARKDYEAAAAFFSESEKAGWNPSACRSAAEKFGSVVREHKIVEAQYMVGRSYHACGLLQEAESAYRDALAINKNHAQSISNLGELYWQVGKPADARSWWETAIKADPKLVAARVNLASMLLEQIRASSEDANWKKLEKEARNHLSSALAVDNDHYRAFVVYGMVYMEGWEKNKNRLDLAKLLLEEAKKKGGEGFAPLHLAFGLLSLHRNNLTDALASFTKAVELDGKFIEAHLNVGTINLGFRKYEVAKQHFSTVVELSKGQNYDALIGQGVAQRGLTDLDGAEASYNAAKALDPKRGESLFNLGVLYKDFRAAKAADLPKSQEAYRKAQQFFEEFLTKPGNNADRDEAKANIDDCKKLIKQIDDFIKASAAQPAPAG